MGVDSVDAAPHWPSDSDFWAHQTGNGEVMVIRVGSCLVKGDVPPREISSLDFFGLPPCGLRHNLLQLAFPSHGAASKFMQYRVNA